MANKYLYFSIIIPVFNDIKNLKLCLSAFANIDYPKDCYEIIIADNNSTDDTHSLKDLYPEVVWLHEKRQGSYAARNKGLPIARGEIIAFTDSDCIPDKNWLKTANKIFNKYNISVLAGEIKPYFLSERPNLYEYLDSIRFLNQKEYAKRGFAATANLFIRKDLFARYGLFNADLYSGGDYEFTKRLSKNGEKFYYSAESIVKHKARATLADLANKSKRTGKGQKQLRKLGVLKPDNYFLRLMLPRKTIPHNDYIKHFSFIQKIKIFLLFNYIHYVNLYYKMV